MIKRKWVRIVLGVLFAAWLLYFPPTRAVLIFLLPLGSGLDDLVEIILLVFAVVYLIINVLLRPKGDSWNDVL